MSAKIDQIGGMDYATAQVYRKAIFDLVCDKKNWKNPIWAVVDDTPNLRAAINDAVIFFTGEAPTIDNKGCKPGKMAVTGRGYYNVIGA